MSRTRSGRIYHRTYENGDQLNEVVATLGQIGGWLPANQSWWFGWHELEIALPSLWAHGSALPSDWDVVHLFSPQIELRWVRRGERWQAVLLTETSKPETLSGWENEEGVYSVKQTHRILWGNRLRVAGNDLRGVVQFPRELAYQIDGEPAKSNNYKKAIVAEAWAYYDDEARLQTVRYAKLGHVDVGGIPINGNQS